MHSDLQPRNPSGAAAALFLVDICLDPFLGRRLPRHGDFRVGQALAKAGGEGLDGDLHASEVCMHVEREDIAYWVEHVRKDEARE